MTDVQESVTGTGDPQALVRRFFEGGWNSGDANAVADLIADDYESNDGGFFVTGSDVPGGLRRLRGVDAFAEHLSRYAQRYGELRFTLEKIIVDGAQVVVIWSPSGVVLGRTFTNRGGQESHFELGGHGVSVIDIVDGRVARNDMFWPIGPNSA